MNTVSKSVLAITGLALSLGACAPAFKGEGTKKPNLQRILKAEEKALVQQAEAEANIGSVKRGKKTDDGFVFTLKLENVPDLKKKTYKITLSTDSPKDHAVLEGIDGKIRRYTLEVQCLESCEKLAAVVTSEPLPAKLAEPTSTEDQAAPASEESGEDVLQVLAQSESEPEEDETAAKEEASDEKEALLETQVGSTAPEQIAANLEKLKSKDITQTGVIADAKEKKIIAKRPLNPNVSFAENVQEMLGFIGKKQVLKLN